MMDGMSEDGGVPSRPPSEEREGLGLGGILQPRECLVQQEDFVDNEYSLGSLDLVGEEPQNCAVIAIRLCQGKLLVGVPEAVWHRSLSRRRLPPKALSRPVLAAVVACSATKRAEEDADIVASTKVWTGLLDPMMEKEISYVEGLEFDHHFGLVGEELALPYGKALVEVANEHFGFVTAESEVQQPHGAVPPLEDRLRMLEENLEAMRGSLAAIAGEARGGGRAVPLPAKPSPKPAPAPKDLPGMDPTTVRAALQAGIPAHHLEEMAKIMRTRPARLEDVPRKSALKKPAQGGARGRRRGWRSRTYPRRIWICRRTSEQRLGGSDHPADHHCQQTHRRRGEEGQARPDPGRRRWFGQSCRWKLPPYVSQELSGLESSATLSSGRPEIPVPSGGGELARRLSWEGCECRRTPSPRHDCERLAYQQEPNPELPAACEVVLGFRRDLGRRAEEARARCALMMCAADQAAIDGGNWLMSTVALLEPVPPYQQFANHLAPGPAEPQYSMLYDPRWAEIFLTHLKEVDSFVDTKKKLGGRGAGKIETEEEKTARAKAAAAKAKSKAERAERARAQRTGGSEGGGGG